MWHAVTVLETIIVPILVLILVTFLVDCQRHMLVQNTMMLQNLLHIEPRILQIRNERKKVI